MKDSILSLKKKTSPQQRTKAKLLHVLSRIINRRIKILNNFILDQLFKVKRILKISNFRIISDYTMNIWNNIKYQNENIFHGWSIPSKHPWNGINSIVQINSRMQIELSYNGTQKFSFSRARFTHTHTHI